jgi:Winged helix-turn helix
VSHDDVLFGFRLRLFSLAGEIGVRPACRAMGVHHSTYYRWKRRVERWGLEALRVRERRRPRMPNGLGPHLEQRVLAFTLAHPGFGPRLREVAARRHGDLVDEGSGVHDSEGCSSQLGARLTTRLVPSAVEILVDLLALPVDAEKPADS